MMGITMIFSLLKEIATLTGHELKVLFLCRQGGSSTALMAVLSCNGTAESQFYGEQSHHKARLL